MTIDDRIRDEKLQHEAEKQQKYQLHHLLRLTS